MAKINILDSSVYNKIAAGEVVERPASVVKELVENSIDAGATIVTVEIMDGGTSKIKVSDNGCGIEKEYLKNAFLPHATSKIKDAEDLENILTLGFRGEALASIAAVSKVSLVSRAEGEDIANAIDVEGGIIKAEYETGRNQGTTLTVSDLFFNVPARQKFLKSAKSEATEVTNLMTRFILAHPEISFEYISDGKTVLSSSGKTAEDAVYSVYGKSAIAETLKVNFERNNFKIKGYLGRPSYSKPNRTYQTLILNGRYIINNTISLAITNAFGEMLMKRKYPFYVLYFTLPTDFVDVNVHPNKMDVRFENNNQIYSLFFEAISRTLDQMDYVASADDKNVEKIIEEKQDKNILSSFKKLDEENDIVVETKKAVPETKSATNTHFVSWQDNKSSKIDKAGVNLNPFSKNISSLTIDEKKVYKDTIINAVENTTNGSGASDGFGLGSKLLERLANSDEKGVEEFENYSQNDKPLKNTFAEQSSLKILPTIKKIGKIFNTYIIVEVDDDVFFIDQHAAHERVLYEKFKKQYNEKNIVVQPLLFPYVLSLNSLEAGIIEENLESIKSLGFDIDEFGDNTFKISSVPAIVSDIDFDKFFGEFISDNKSTVKKSSDLIQDYLM
ncbi:MAG: DNA mismatch repair endonuclease MutL [Clostridia bacterium]|nr:DNA mismatch repair endonuclease MutL [Clostridia bacterium]